MRIHNNRLNWTPPGHEIQYKKWIRDLSKTKRFKSLIKKHPNKPAFELWFMNYCPNAYRLKAYMDFRAFHEKQSHKFNEFFYLSSFLEGCFNFFGIKCCDCCGRILKDTQNPTAYEWFCEFEDEEIEKLKQRTLH